MTDLTQALGATASGLRAQATRLRHLSENIANADTPGYRRKTISFQQAKEGVRVGNMSLDDAEGIKHFDPNHPLADESGHYFGSNVNLLVEIADAREAQRSYEANLKVFEQTRQMSASLIDILRR